MLEKNEEKGITKSEMVELLSNQFETVFRLIDDVKVELKNEIKFQIGEFRKEMNYRFLTIENNMVYKHEHDSVVHRVEKLEE